jgi:dihydroorotate dehydrogenase (fumarate)
MENLTTHYLGLELKNPVIIGSSGLTNSVNKIKELEKNGAGAVVLKSLFEEQIIAEIKDSINADLTNYTESYDLISRYVREHSLDEYLKLISEAKKQIDIPIIASINCMSGYEWSTFAKRIESAGADALELNIALLPSDETLSSNETDKMHFEIAQIAGGNTSLPIALKVSQYSGGLAKLITELSWMDEVSGFVLFNRLYNPDIDLDNYDIISSNIYSQPEEISTSLRWVALMSGKIEKDIAASTGVHSGAGVIKQILAGAKAVQVVSAIYQNGPEHIQTILNSMKQWMNKHTYEDLSEFRGIVNYGKSKNPAAFERVQFMKYYAGLE